MDVNSLLAEVGGRAAPENLAGLRAAGWRASLPLCGAVSARGCGSRAGARPSPVKAELMRRRRLPVPEQGRWLASVIRGHEAYYAVPGNAEAVQAFRYHVTRHWRFALSRRSQKNRVTWERMSRLARRHLPTTRIRHPWPEARFAARYP